MPVEVRDSFAVDAERDPEVEIVWLYLQGDWIGLIVSVLTEEKDRPADLIILPIYMYIYIYLLRIIWAQYKFLIEGRGFFYIYR